MTVESPANDQQITVEVPAERVAEFYALFGRFLAGFPGRRRRGPGHHRGHRGHGPCHHRGGPHHGEHEHDDVHATDEPAERPVV